MNKQRPILLVLLAGLASLVSLVGCGKEYRLDALTLSEDAAEVLAAVSAEPVFKLEKLPEIRIGEQAEIESALFGEVFPTAKSLGMEESRARSFAHEQSRGLARVVGAKYFEELNAVLVLPENISLVVQTLEEGASATRDVLRGLLLLECARAVKMARYGPDPLPTDQDFDRSMCQRALVEGFGRFLAQRLATRHGWERSLEMCTKMMIGEPPAEILSMEDASATQAYNQNAFVHLKGERFVTAVFEARGEEGVREMMASPPTEQEIIARPEWYLDPSKRPQSKYDLEPALALFEKRFDPELWRSERLHSERGRVAMQMAMCEREDIDRVLNGIVGGRTAVLSHAEEPQRRNAALQIKEHVTAEEAQFFVARVAEIIRADRTGNVSEVEGANGSWTGILFAESAEGGNPEMVGGVVTAGELSVSVTFAGETVGQEVVRQVFDLVVSTLPGE